MLIENNAKISKSAPSLNAAVWGTRRVLGADARSRPVYYKLMTKVAVFSLKTKFNTFSTDSKITRTWNIVLHNPSWYEYLVNRPKHNTRISAVSQGRHFLSLIKNARNIRGIGPCDIFIPCEETLLFYVPVYPCGKQMAD